MELNSGLLNESLRNDGGAPSGPPVSPRVVEWHSSVFANMAGVEQWHQSDYSQESHLATWHESTFSSAGPVHAWNLARLLKIKKLTLHVAQNRTGFHILIGL